MGQRRRSRIASFGPDVLSITTTMTPMSTTMELGTTMEPRMITLTTMA